MIIKWNKLGKILDINTQFKWLNRWAGAACVLPFTDKQSEIITLFVTGREPSGESSIGTVKFNINSLKMLHISKKPILSHGTIGNFDEDGISYPCVIKHRNQFFLYYTGWQKGKQNLWYNGLGLAVSDDGHTFNKYSQAPIISRNHDDHIGIGSSWIIYDKKKYRMWYTSFSRWEKNKHGYTPFYKIKYTTSSDGICWDEKRYECISYTNANESCIAKPSVIKIYNKYFMWYSYRGESYRIGFAVSDNGIDWIRKDNLAGIDKSSAGWDSEMICYANVFMWKNYLYMLYNGNGYGKTGLGLARIEKEKFKKIT